MQSQQQQQQQQSSQQHQLDDDPLEFEEWDGQSPFWVHCAAGSVAGVAEHVSVYPLDTVKTHIQCAACPKQRSFRAAGLQGSTNHMWMTVRQIVSTPALTATAAAPQASSGFSKLFRGVQTMLVGCVPAHALYFSSYEAVKWYYTEDNHLSSHGAALAGAAAVVGHDFVMTPLDTIKQRLQLGHYNNGVGQALKEIFARPNEGLLTLYRSFPVTLLTNIPYGAIMVYTNEQTKELLSARNDGGGGQNSLADCLVASSLAGMIASGLTTPLDRIKTSLQIQGLQPVRCERYGGDCATPFSKAPPAMEWHQVLRKILKEEGMAGLWRGTLPRVLSHTPAVAISWTTYETCKQWLMAL